VQEAESTEAQLAVQVRMAEIQLEALRAGLSDEEVRVIEAQVEQARAGLEALRRQRAMLTLTSPISGTVSELLMVPGEVAAQGAALMRIADLAALTLTVYVPETRLGDLQIGQPVEIHVDSFPDQTFAGEIIRIADQAEFTPRNVSTQEERVNLVFAVEVAVRNVEGGLRPGMPADATFKGGSP
jgi:multidrug resistance efflux pump